MRQALLASCAVLVLGIAPSVGSEDAYLAGLDALAAGRFPEAVERLAAAREAEDEVAERHVAYAAALVFAERFDAALKALDRAGRLDPRRKDVGLWRATALAMQGDLFEDSKHFPAATRDPFETDLRELSRRYGDPAFRATRLRDPVPDAEGVRARERARFPGLAARFVARLRPASPQLAGALGERGKARLASGDAAGAFADLRDALAQAPDDLALRLALARARLALGGAIGARRDATRVLVRGGASGPALALRGRAALASGAAEAARLDLEAARALGEDVGADLARLAERAGAPAAPVRLLDVVADPAGAGELVRAVEARRLRADETYERRLRALRLGGDPLALASFLHDESLVALTEWVEPRTSPRPVREADPEREIAEAERVLDGLLAQASPPPRALAYRAACHMRRNQWEAARGLLDRAIAAAPDDPVVLDLVAREQRHAAAVNAAAAADLRQVRTWSDHMWIYTRWPSQAERAEAAALDRLARWLRERADAALERAARLAGDTARGALLTARLHETRGQAAEARAAYERAVERDPSSVEAWSALAVLRTAAGDRQGGYVAQDRAANLTHTTAAPMLKWAWLEVSRTAYKSAEIALAAAEAADAADPRVAAYRAVVLEGREKPAEAAAWMRAALALETARLAADGIPLAGEGPLEAADVGMAALLAFHVARLSDADAALAVVRWLDRVPQAQRYVPLTGAMLPSTTAPPDRLPEAWNLETIAAWARLRMGSALVRTGRYVEALAHFDWVAGFEARKPSIADAGQPIREPWTLALAYRAVALRRLNRHAEARTAAMSVPRRRDLPPESQAELEALRAELGR